MGNVYFHALQQEQNFIFFKAFYKKMTRYKNSNKLKYCVELLCMIITAGDAFC